MRTLLLLVLIVAACGEQDTPLNDTWTWRIASVESLQGDKTRGQALYMELCSSCHGKSGSDGETGPKLAEVIGEEAVEAMLLGPAEMPAFDALNDQQLADLEVFVESF